jgi:shikimate kinase
MSSSGHSPRRRLICLAGFMGCGKTTVGRLLAAQLAWRFVDLDERIEQSAGASISDIFERQGEPAFRGIEREQLAHALGEVSELDAPTVLALGGGSFAQAENVALVREFAAGPGAVTIWLDCPVEELLARCATMTNRPLFRNEIGFRELYATRLPFYQQADYRVASDVDPRRVVERILALGFLEKVTA